MSGLTRGGRGWGGGGPGSSAAPSLPTEAITIPERNKSGPEPEAREQEDKVLTGK